MRLTLRALLAYLYNVLEPAEAEEFAGKVQESPVASGLVQRIRGITHKVRMSAPRIDAKGLTDDANNVAEYLDNNLADDRVADFERTCLESDTHLAEVAGSYQILTMVLGKPAEVPEQLRQRVYALPSDADSVHSPDAEEDTAEKSRIRSRIAKAASAASDVTRPQAEVKTTSTHPVPEVPDYLRSRSRFGIVPIMAASLLAFLVVVIGIGMLGRYDRTNPALSWMFPKENVADANVLAKPDETEKPAEIPESVAAKTDIEPPVKPEGTAVPVAPDVLETKKEPGPSSDINIKPESVKAESSVPPSETVPPPAGSPANATKTVPEGPKIPLKKPEPTAPKNDMELGVYTSDEQVLARYNAQEMTWQRVSPREPIVSGERLQALPSFRPQITLTSGMLLTFAGESLMILETGSGPESPRMLMNYGRIVLDKVGTGGARLEADLTGLKGTLILTDPNTRVAIDARRYLPPGSDPEKDRVFVIVEIYTVGGAASWKTEGEDAVEIPTAHLLTYVLGVEPVEKELAGPLREPAWVSAANISDIERATSLVLMKLLGPEKPLDIRLQELLPDSRVEVRSLAARCLSCFDQFEPLLRNLANVQHKAFWEVEVSSLRSALARSPKTASQVHSAARALRGDQGETIYRLLWGYSPLQLADVGAAELVDLLQITSGVAKEQADVDIHVLAIDNLKRITGLQHDYRAEKRPDENKLSIKQWKKDLAEAAILYKEDPNPFMERVPLEKPAAKRGIPKRK